MLNNINVLLIMLGLAAPVAAQMDTGVGYPNVSIGINLTLYPDLVRVPDYPVYYAPRVNSNYFFYDGMFWVYQGDRWYTSSWYNGPWAMVDQGNRTSLIEDRGGVRDIGRLRRHGGAGL
jgi:hypothetical protein